MGTVKARQRKSLVLGLVHGQQKGELAPVLCFTLDPNFAAMRLDKALGDRESKAHACGVARAKCRGRCLSPTLRRCSDAADGSGGAPAKEQPRKRDAPRNAGWRAT